MRYLMFLILLCTVFSLSAQEGIRKKNSFNIVTGVFIGNKIEGARYIALKNRMDQQAVPFVDDDPIPVGNYRLGLDYQRQIIGGFSAKIGTRIATWSLGSKTRSNRYIHTSLFIETPLSFQYKFGKKRWQPYIELGVSPMFSIPIKNDGFFRNYAPKYGFSIHAATGFSYQVTENFSCFGQIAGHVQTEAFKYGMYPYEIGLELGVAFHF